MTRLRLAANRRGAPARLTAGGRGTRLALPPLATLASPVTVALRARSGRCWAATYSAPFAAHGTTVFRARAD